MVAVTTVAMTSMRRLVPMAVWTGNESRSVSMGTTTITPLPPMMPTMTPAPVPMARTRRTPTRENAMKDTIGPGHIKDSHLLPAEGWKW